MPGEHLLLATLGESPGAVLSVLDWLANPSAWSAAGKPLPPKAPPLTHLWVITTSACRDKLYNELVYPLKRHYPSLRCRMLYPTTVEDICTARDNEVMTELLFRLILQGESWRGEQEQTGRYFTVALSGGRKTMSAVPLQAASFFRVDHTVHMVCDGGDGPEDLDGIQNAIARHHPILLSRRPSPWRALLDVPWALIHSDTPLHPSSFPLSDDWSESAPPRQDEVALSDPEGPFLSKMLEDIAARAAEIADKALAGGVGSSFLRHDLTPLVKRMQRDAALRDPGLAALVPYFDGLGRVMGRASEREDRFSLRDLNACVRDAVLLAVARIPTPTEPHGWTVPGLIELKIEGLPAVEELTVCGIRREVLTMVLRNLIANISRHAQPQPQGTLTLEPPTPDRPLMTLTVRNRVPADKLPALQIRKRGDGELPELLLPFERGPDSHGDGLGLFTVRRAVDQSRGAIGKVVPQLEPRPKGDGFDFVVCLPMTVEG